MSRPLSLQSDDHDDVEVERDGDDNGDVDDDDGDDGDDDDDDDNGDVDDGGFKARERSWFESFSQQVQLHADPAKLVGLLRKGGY